MAGAVHDRWGNSAARRSLPPLLVAGGAFFVVTLAVPGTFRVFIAYEAVAMLFALAVYGTLAVSRTRGSLAMAAGVMVTMVAAGIQVTPLSVRVIWQLDHNSLFHLIQIIGMALLFSGLRASLEQASSSAVQAVPSGRPSTR